MVLCACENISPPPVPPDVTGIQKISQEDINYDENLGDYYFNHRNYSLSIDCYNNALSKKKAQTNILYKIQKAKYALAQKQHEQMEANRNAGVLGIHLFVCSFHCVSKQTLILVFRDRFFYDAGD